MFILGSDINKLYVYSVHLTSTLGRQAQKKHLWSYAVALGGVVVSVLATGPKVRGFKPGRGRWILRVIKSVARLPSKGK
jgi:hypothetical protein